VLVQGEGEARMESEKICPRCGGAVRIQVVRDAHGSASALGECVKCGARFSEQEVLTLPGGPGPVGG